MIDYTIRPATIDDYDALATIFAEVDLLHRNALPRIFRPPDGSPLSREYFEDGLADEAFAWLVAERAGELLGFATVRVVQTPDHPMLLPRRYAEVNNLAVRERYRRSGIGQALMRRAEGWAAERGLSELELTVWGFNQSAIDFYQKLGYSTQRRIMWKTIGDANR